MAAIVLVIVWRTAIMQLGSKALAYSTIPTGNRPSMAPIKKGRDFAWLMLNGCPLFQIDLVTPWSSINRQELSFELENTVLMSE